VRAPPCNSDPRNRLFRKTSPERLVLSSISVCEGNNSAELMTEVVSTRLLPLERARRYREFARDTFRLAEQAERPEVKATYLSLTACWTSLAREAENAAERAPIVSRASN
jgi:hypothetical protein